MTNWFWHRASGGRLLALLEGALNPEQQVRLEKHLRRCAACRRELEHLRETQSAILGAREAFPVAVPQGDLWARVSERLGPAEPEPRGSGRPFLRVSAVAAAAAVLVIGVRLAQGPAAQRTTQVARAVSSEAPEPRRQAAPAKGSEAPVVKPRSTQVHQASGLRHGLPRGGQGRVSVTPRARKQTAPGALMQRRPVALKLRRAQPAPDALRASAMLARLPEDIKLDSRETPKGAATDGDHLSGIVSARNVLNTSPEAVNRSLRSGVTRVDGYGEGSSDFSSITPPVAAKPAPASPATSLGVLGSVTRNRDRVGGAPPLRGKEASFNYAAKPPSGSRSVMGGVATSGAALDALINGAPEREALTPLAPQVAEPSLKREMKGDASARPAGPQPRSAGSAGALSEEGVKPKDSALALKAADTVAMVPRLQLGMNPANQSPLGDRPDLRQQLAKGQQPTVESLVAEGRAFLLKGLWARAKAAFTAALARDPSCQAARDGLKSAERLGHSQAQTQSRQQSQTQKPQPRRR